MRDSGFVGTQAGGWRIDDRRVDSGSRVLSIPLAKCVAIRRSVINGQ